MSPPIRDGSGNSIGAIRLGDGSEIAEVRTGAGDVLFSADPPIADSLVSRFNFENDVTDSVGSNDGSIVGSPTFTTTAKVGNTALEFFGGSDGVNISNPIIPEDSPQTITAYVKIPDQTAGKIVDIGNDRFIIAYKARGETGYEFRMFGSNSHLIEHDGPLNEFVHLAASFDGDKQEFFVNGTSVGSNTGTGYTYAGGGETGIGYEAVNDVDHLQGIVDDVQFYNKGLTSTEVSNLINTGSIKG